MAKMNVKKGDIVAIISGKDRGKRGRVLRTMPAKSMLLVEGAGMVKRHTRPNPQQNVKGGILEKESPLHVSNVMLIDPETDEPTRVSRQRLEDGRRVRVARSSGATLDK